jgi:hypothetical protein
VFTLNHPVAKPVAGGQQRLLDDLDRRMFGVGFGLAVIQASFRVSLVDQLQPRNRTPDGRTHHTPKLESRGHKLVDRLGA